MFKNIQAAIQTFLSKTITEERKKVEVLWEEVANKEEKKNLQIVGFKNKTLVLQANNPAAKIEFLLQKETLKKKLTIKNQTILKT